MCHNSCLAFGNKHLKAADIQGKRVLEVGACDVNGSLRPYIEGLRPHRYLGVDIQLGKGVDEECPVDELLRRYGPESFDLVVSTEMLEHVEDWLTSVANLKGVVRRGGLLLLTTRSLGFPPHGYPWDFWRYEVADLARIFGDFEIRALEDDPEAPGVFLLARKPLDFRERDVSRETAYSMLLGRRVCRLTAAQRLWFHARMRVGPLLPGWLRRWLGTWLSGTRGHR